MSHNTLSLNLFHCENLKTEPFTACYSTTPLLPCILLFYSCHKELRRKQSLLKMKVHGVWIWDWTNVKLHQSSKLDSIELIYISALQCNNMAKFKAHPHVPIRVKPSDALLNTNFIALSLLSPPSSAASPLSSTCFSTRNNGLLLISTSCSSSPSSVRFCFSSATQTKAQSVTWHRKKVIMPYGPVSVCAGTPVPSLLASFWTG